MTAFITYILSGHELYPGHRVLMHYGVMTMKANKHKNNTKKTCRHESFPVRIVSVMDASLQHQVVTFT